MRILKILLVVKSVIIIGITVAGTRAIIAHEGSTDSLVLLFLSFMCILLIAIVWKLETIKEIKEIEKNEQKTKEPTLQR